MHYGIPSLLTTILDSPDFFRGDAMTIQASQATPAARSTPPCRRRAATCCSARCVAGTTTVIGDAVMSTASAAPGGRLARVLVVLSLRGAADGMSLVVPHGDPVYYEARPRIAIPKDQLIAPDSFFGMHPALAPLLPLWSSGKLGWVHASGLPAPNRSHFSAMEELEDAEPGSATRTGWLNRLIGLPDGESSPLQAINIGTGIPPAALAGPAPYMNASRIEDIRLAGAKDPQDKRRQVAGHPVGQAATTRWATPPAGPSRWCRPSTGSTAPRPPGRAHPPAYPKGDLGKAFSNAARIVRGDVGVEVITIDHGKWDMHSGLGDLTWGQMLENATEMSQSIAAFFRDLGALGDKVTVVALSEFGRRVQENVNMGLDHGYGNVMMVAGAGVKGGYYGRWPGITNELDSDLLVTTDYRSVLVRGGRRPVRREHGIGLPRLRTRTGRGDARPVEPGRDLARPSRASGVMMPPSRRACPARHSPSPSLLRVARHPRAMTLPPRCSAWLADRGGRVDVADGVPAGASGAVDARGLASSRNTISCGATPSRRRPARRSPGRAWPARPRGSRRCRR